MRGINVILMGLLALPATIAVAAAQPVALAPAIDHPVEVIVAYKVGPRYPYVPIQHLPAQDCQALATKVNADIRMIRRYVFNGADWFDSDTWGVGTRLDRVEAAGGYADDDTAATPKPIFDRDVAAAQKAGCVSQTNTDKGLGNWLTRVRQVALNPVSSAAEIRAVKAGIPVVSYVPPLPVPVILLR